MTHKYPYTRIKCYKYIRAAGEHKFEPNLHSLCLDLFATTIAWRNIGYNVNELQIGLLFIFASFQISDFRRSKCY